MNFGDESRGWRKRALIALLLAANTAWSADYFLYAGTYTNQKSKGIYAWRFQPESGKLTELGLAAETPSPSFLAVHPNQRFLYAVNEMATYKGVSSGSVSSFAIDRTNGKLKALNTVSSQGAGPCHLSIDKSGKSLLVANYDAGSVAVLAVGENGVLSEPSKVVQHHGSSSDPERQKSAHAHCAVLSPDQRFALVADLGLDQVLIYKLNAAAASIEPNDPPLVKIAAGSGPRHIAFHPMGRLAYVINELASTITTFSYNPAKGMLSPLQILTTLPPEFKGKSFTAEIEVHPSGKFVYGSNRGHDSIAVFSVDPDTGTLKLIQHVATGGKTPRNFAIDPTGAFLLAANQDSGNIVQFRIDRSTGRLTPSGVIATAPNPVDLVFVPVL